MATALTLATGGGVRDLVVDLEPGDLVESLQHALGVPALWLGSRRLDPAASVAAAGVRSGVVLTTGPGALRVDGRPVASVPGLLVSAAGVTVAGEPLSPGVPRRLDGHVVELVRDDPPGEAEVRRPPRLARGVVPDEAHQLRAPLPPPPVPLRRLALLPLLLPLVLGAVMAVVSSPLFLLLTVASPLAAAGSWWSDRRGARTQRRLDLAAHELALSEHETELTRLVAAEAASRLRADPAPEEVARWGSGLDRRLWERRPGDGDWLVLRVGVSMLPARTVLVDGAPVPVRAPVRVDLAATGVVGLAGSHREGLARALLTCAVAQHGPGDLELVLLAEDSVAAECWAWTRWLPHLRRHRGEPDGDLAVGCCPETMAERLTELTTLVAERTRDRTVAPRPAVLVVVEGSRRLHDVPAFADLLLHGPAAGVLVLCLEARERDLPEQCRAVAVSTGSLRLVVTGQAEVCGTGDSLDELSAEASARSLAPLREVDAGRRELPPAVRLLDLLDLAVPSPEAVRQRWSRAAPSPLGVDAQGVVELDLVRDGPHALVAGTTGSGKSELLQTLVASLAASHPPEELTFVLVDYKGGAAFRDCSRLPHTVGMVTDLDGSLVERALTSLTAELQARERRLGEAGATDLTGHRAAGSPGGVLPQLVLVVDEFAALAQELPEFVRGLVGIAQRGRSLGVHLVLATQRPSGVVSAEIRANTALRIALRVTDAADSTDVVDVPSAAALPRHVPGRAVLRTGHEGLRTLQVARVGGARPGAVRRQLAARPWDWTGGGNAPRGVAVEDDETDLHLLVEAIRAASSSRLPAPWLPPLPEAVQLDEGWALLDLPAHQAVRSLRFDLVHGGHLLVAGTHRSGRTTLLRTLACSLATEVTADRVHLHVLEGGSNDLACLEGLPHCGVVTGRAQPERAERLLVRLSEEVARRQAVGPEEARPHLVLLVDGWDRLLSAWDDLSAPRLTDLLHGLLRDGLAVGVQVVLTGDRSLLTGKLPSLVGEVLCLRLSERSDYALAGLPVRSVPSDVPPGRGFDQTGRALHVGLLDADPSAAAQDAAVDSLARCLRENTASTLAPAPLRIDLLPTSITAARAAHLPRREHLVPVAVGGDELAWHGFDPSAGAFVVAGPPRSGRSSALLAAAAASPVPVLAVVPRPSPLRDWPGCLDGRDPHELAARLNTGGPLLVVVDDAEALQGSPVDDLLEQLVRAGPAAGQGLLLAGTTDELGLSFRGFVAAARASRSGLLLCPESHLQGELLGLRLPRSACFSGPPGRGLFVERGRGTLVQVPLPSAEPQARAPGEPQVTRT